MPTSFPTDSPKCIRQNEWVNHVRTEYEQFSSKVCSAPFCSRWRSGLLVLKTKTCHHRIIAGGGGWWNGRRISKSTTALPYDSEDVFSWLEMLGCCTPLIVFKAPTKFGQYNFWLAVFLFVLMVYGETKSGSFLIFCFPDITQFLFFFPPIFLIQPYF